MIEMKFYNQLGPGTKDKKIWIRNREMNPERWF